MKFSGLLFPKYLLLFLLGENTQPCCRNLVQGFSLSSRIINVKARAANNSVRLFQFLASSVDTLEGLLRHEEESSATTPGPFDEPSIRYALLDLATTAASLINLPATTAINGDISSSCKDNEEIVPSIQDRFQPLLGEYKVLFTLSSNPNERPVGGKWTRGGNKSRFFFLQGSWQHLAKPIQSGSVAQAINVITLRALFFRITVLLRGDAYPLTIQERLHITRERQTPFGGLSDLTVRADFDPPRIFLKGCGMSGNGRDKKVLMGFSIGPRSSVVLDTPYYNKHLRLGKGSRGTLFVFGRTQDPAVQEEWRHLVARKTLGKIRLMILSGAITLALGYVVTWVSKAQWSTWWHVLLLAPMFAASLFSTVLVAISSGGIEQDQSMNVLDSKTGTS